MSTALNIVQVKEGRLIVNSMDLARVFDKEHKNVLRKIDAQVANYPAEFTRLNFELSEYIDETGKANRMYHLSQIGFAAVASSFSGKKADIFRAEVLTEFERMETELRKRQLPISSIDIICQMAAFLKEQDTRSKEQELRLVRQETTTADSGLTLEQIQELTFTIKARVKAIRNRRYTRWQTENAIIAKLKRRFIPLGVRGRTTFKDIKQADFAAALEFVGKIELSLS